MFAVTLTVRFAVELPPLPEIKSVTVDPSKTRRLELILRQIDALPTLPAIATRLLTLTASDDSNATLSTLTRIADVIKKRGFFGYRRAHPGE